MNVLFSFRGLLTFLLVASLLVMAGCADREPEEPTLNVEFEPEGQLDFLRPDSSIITRIAIEFAESDEEQAQGLMFRRSLPDRGGMLFIDAEPTMQSFWMRNTPLPLDVIFVDTDGQIVNIVKRTTPLSEERILSTGPAQYVVEVRAGFTDNHGIDSTAHVSWRRRSFETSTQNP